MLLREFKVFFYVCGRGAENGGMDMWMGVDVTEERVRSYEGGGGALAWKSACLQMACTRAVEEPT